MVFQVTAPVSDGLQDLASGTPVVIVPASGSSVTVNSQSIDIPIVFTVLVPQPTTLTNGETVIINNHTYQVANYTAGTQPSPQALLQSSPLPLRRSL